VDAYWVEVHGLRTCFLQAGHGRPVLLVHGAGGTAEDWATVVAGLARHYRAIAVDLPGNGFSEPMCCASPECVAAFLWCFLREIGVGHAAVAGHSHGGAIAVHMALQRPASVPRLTLVSSVGMGRAISPIQIVQSGTPLGDLSPLISLLPFGPQNLTAKVALAGTNRPWRLPARWWESQTRAASSPEAIRTALRMERFVAGPFGQRQLLLAELPRLAMPTLVAWGVRDRVLPYHQARRAARRLPHAHLALFPLAGHLLPIEAPEDLLDVMMDFLD
jgi:pimeloyl-ACP methyl ester carboxylesterase